MHTLEHSHTPPGKCNWLSRFLHLHIHCHHPLPALGSSLISLGTLAFLLGPIHKRVATGFPAVGWRQNPGEVQTWMWWKRGLLYDAPGFWFPFSGRQSGYSEFSCSQIPPVSAPLHWRRLHGAGLCPQGPVRTHLSTAQSSSPVWIPGSF